MNRRAVGRTGEAIARAYLEERGYECIGENVRTMGGELDLVMRQGGRIVFVEVKYRRSRRFGAAVEAVDEKKLARVEGAALAYLAEHGLPANTDMTVAAFAIDDGDGERTCTFIENARL